MEDTEYLKLSIEEQCVHKVWKARLHGYEEAGKLFRQITDEKSPEFGKYLGLVKKFVVDSNAVAQEKGLEAVLAYVENYALSGKTVGDVMSGIVAKCIAAPKAKTKELAVQITLMYIEIEKFEAVQEELLKGMEHKNPKTVAACVAAMTEALKEFGAKVVNIKSLVKKVPVLLEDRDKTVRDEGKALVIEMYRWIGVALKPQLSALKPVQVTELEAEFEKVKGGKVVPTRYLRSQQQKQAKLAAEMCSADDVDGDPEDDGPTVEVDPYDLVDPVDVLSKLPKDFYEKLEAKKWQERKEAVDNLEKLLDTPKLESGDYGELVRSLKKVISKDTNVMVIAVAGKCLASLANGLKKRFQPYAGVCIPCILEKFKEKKQNVVVAIKEAIDAVYNSTTIEAIMEDCIEFLENKNPQVKGETAAFLARCFTKCTPMMLSKKLLKGYSVPLLKLLNDPDPTVRDHAAEALGTAMKVVGEKGIMPFLADIEALKMGKIKECCEKAVIVAKVPKSERPATAPAKTSSDDGVTKGGSAAPRPVKRPASAATKKPVVKKAGTTSAAASSSTASKAAAKGKTKGEEKELNDDEVEEKIADILPEQLVSGLIDVNWKARLVAVEQLVEIIRETDQSVLPVQALLRCLNKKPGLKDTNFQVLKARIEAVKMLADLGEMSRVSMECCTSDIADKLGDPKNGPLAAETLTSIAEATNLNSVAVVVLDFAFNQKNPKVQIESLNWLSDAIREFGFVVKPKALMDSVKKAVAATHPGVRAAGISFVGTMYLYVGQQITSFFDNEKPALQQLITAEFEKLEGEIPPAPTRGLKKGGSDESPEEAKVNIQDFMERIDVSHLISDTLISDLQDKNWKERNEALQKMANILAENKCISSNLGELPPILAQRLVDSNGKIASSAMAVCQTLAVAMGAHGKVHIRTFFPNILLGLGDSKVWIRNAAASCINVWGEQCGFKFFFDGEMIGDALKSGSPTLRTELWNWLAEKLPEIPPKSFPKDELMVCLPHLYSNLEDRNGDVRKAALEAVPAFLIHLGHNSMLKASEKLKPATYSVISSILMKSMGNIPIKAALSMKNISEEAEPGKMAKTGNAKAPVSNKITKSKSTAKVGSRKKEEELDTTPLLSTNNLKNQRSIDEQKLKILKWNFTTPREEFVEQLRDLMTTANVNKNLMANMFHMDFKYHLKAIDMLSEDLPHNLPATIANLDLILKWLSLRFFDTNPSVLLKGLEYLNNVFALLIEECYNLLEPEAASFIPHLILKVGDPKDTVRNSVKGLFRQFEMVYPASKLFSYIMDGLKSKNARQRTECLDLLGTLIENYGIVVCQPTPVAALKEIARQISDRDNSVRNAALNCVVQAYFLEGDRVYKMIGQISDKDLSLLEERIKRAAKNRPPPGTRPVLPTTKPSSTQQQPQIVPEQEYPQAQQKIVRHGSEGSLNQDCAESSVSPPETFKSPLQLRSVSPKPRPVSGPFGLDPNELAKIEGKGISLRAPKLNEFDLKDLLGDVTPSEAAKTSSYQFASQTEYHFREKVASSSRPEEIVDSAISNISNPDVYIAGRACVQLEYLLQTDKVKYLAGKENTLILCCVTQLRLLRNTQTRMSSTDAHYKVYRFLFLLILSFYDVESLAKNISKNVLQDLIYQLLVLLVERHFEDWENGDAFIRVINVLVVRIIEKSDHTNVTSALIKSLRDCSLSTSTSPRFTELVMKCLWKVVKLFPTWEDTDLAVILYEIHLFLKDLPSPSWKKRSSDTPLKTIKTFLHTMTKIEGNKIFHYLGRIDNTNESELHSYLVKLLKTRKQEDSNSKPSIPQKETRSLHHTKIPYEMLSSIFQKIGHKQDTKEGLAMLYDFKQQYPEANLDPFLQKSSKYFQDYISQGMKNVEMERRGQGLRNVIPEMGASSEKMDTIPAAAGDATGKRSECTNAELELDTNTSSKDAQYYLMRLQRLQANAGLKPALDSNQIQTHKIDCVMNSENLNLKMSHDTVQEVSPSSRSNNVDSIRQRLEAIKSKK